MNYIVSGLERSGTSLMMQILLAGGFPIAYTAERTPDEHNPNGYYELEKGKIINKLIEGRFDKDTYNNVAIKITSYGLKYLPKGEYKIIYMLRTTEEIYNSQEKMIGKPSKDKKETMELLQKMNFDAMRICNERDDIEMICINYNALLDEPEKELKKVSKFINKDISSGKNVIDKKLYRNRYVTQV